VDEEPRIPLIIFLHLGPKPLRCRISSKKAQETESNALGSVWMSELEGMELNWVQYQISRGIEMRCDSNSIVWMSLHWRLES